MWDENKGNIPPELLSMAKKRDAIRSSRFSFDTILIICFLRRQDP